MDPASRPCLCLCQSIPLCLMVLHWQLRRYLHIISCLCVSMCDYTGVISIFMYALVSRCVIHVFGLCTWAFHSVARFLGGNIGVIHQCILRLFFPRCVFVWIHTCIKGLHPEFSIPVYFHVSGGTSRQVNWSVQITTTAPRVEAGSIPRFFCPWCASLLFFEAVELVSGVNNSQWGLSLLMSNFKLNEYFWTIERGMGSRPQDKIDAYVLHVSWA